MAFNFKILQDYIHDSESVDDRALLINTHGLQSCTDPVYKKWTISDYG